MKDVFQKGSQKTCIADGSSFDYPTESEGYLRIKHYPDHYEDTTYQALELMQSF